MRFRFFRKNAPMFSFLSGKKTLQWTQKKTKWNPADVHRQLKKCKKRNPCSTSASLTGGYATPQRVMPLDSSNRPWHSEECPSFPLDGSRGLGRDIVDDPVHAVDLVDDAVGNAREERVGEADPVGGHPVAAFDRPDGDGVLVGAFVAHDADGTDGEEDGEGLPDLVVEVGLLHLIDDNAVRAAEDGEFAGRDFAEAADGESGAREGLPHDHFFRQSELAAHFAHLVLEEAAEGLEEFELHVFGEAADVVVALDDCAGIAVDGDALDDVRVSGPLSEERHVRDVRAGVAEDLDELAADDLALAFGFVDARELREESVGGVDVHERHLERAAEELADAFRLVLAEQAVVHEDAGELVADGLVDERGGHGGIDAAGEAEDHVRGADGLADLGHGAFDEVGHGPVRGAAADAEAEILDDERAHRGVDDLGVELDAEEAAVQVLHGGELGVVGFRAGLEAFGQARDLVAVGHPHLGLGGDVLEERGRGGRGDDGLAVFAGVAVRHFAAERLDHELEAVADAQHRDAEFEDGRIAFRRVGLVYARGAAAQDDARGRGGADLLRRGLPGDDLTVDVEFADAPGDELTVLGSEIQHENGFRMIHSLTSQIV